MVTELKELRPQRDGRCSFYNKATVSIDGNDVALFSYGTKVAEIRNNVVYIYGWYSVTTARHINEFLYQYCDTPRSMSKQEMLTFADQHVRLNKENFAAMLNRRRV